MAFNPEGDHPIVDDAIPFKSLGKNHYAYPDWYNHFINAFGQRTALSKQTLRMMKGLLPTSRAAHILDLAAGTGLNSNPFLSAGYRVTALDLSTSMTDYLTSQGRLSSVVQADMNFDLPFREEAFDGVTTLFSNRYIVDRGAFIQEIHRVLRPGGIFIWPIFRHDKKLIQNHHLAASPDIANVELMRDAVREAGFSEVGSIKRDPFRMIARQLRMSYSPDFVVAKK